MHLNHYYVMRNLFRTKREKFCQVRLGIEIFNDCMRNKFRTTRTTPISQNLVQSSFNALQNCPFSAQMFR